MTEAEWLADTDPQGMLAYLKGRASDRMFRLFLAALWRRRFGDMRSFRSYQKKVDQAEEMADGRWKPLPGHAGWVGHQRNPRYQATWSMRMLAGLRGKGNVSPATQADLIREVFGNPFRPVAIDPAWLAWNDGTVAKLARAIYDGRDFARLPILADALEEAGCTATDIPGHLRTPGPHVRGCQVLDLLLGKA